MLKLTLLSYDRLRPLIYPQTDLFCICFSVGKPSSFVNVMDKWIQELRYHVGKTTPILLVGCKTDLRKEREEKRIKLTLLNYAISRELGEKLARKIGGISYIETSSKDNVGLSDLITVLAKCILLSYETKNDKCALQ